MSIVAKTLKWLIDYFQSFVYHSGKAMHAHSFTTTRIADAVPRSTSTGQPRARPSRPRTSGEILWIVMLETIANIATPGRSSSFIQRSTNLLNVMTFRTQATAPEEHFVLLHILNVSIHIGAIFSILSLFWEHCCNLIAIFSVQSIAVLRWLASTFFLA